MALSQALEKTCAEIAGRLKTARRLLFITGAGISADSGLPTYRGVGGLYNGEATEEGLDIEDALSGHCLGVRPDITWKYLARIEANCHRVEPNAAHRAIVALEQTHEVVVLTQNIDGLHALAGTRQLIEIHGSLSARYCVDCGQPGDTADEAIPPRCHHCGGVVRPAVVLFGESLPGEAIERLYDELATGFDMIFIIGTTAVFPYVAEPVLSGVRRGIPTVEINPGRTALSERVTYQVACGAADAMGAIQQRLADLG